MQAGLQLPKQSLVLKHSSDADRQQLQFLKRHFLLQECFAIRRHLTQYLPRHW
jgi:hypothetical protein